jgi:ubiquinone/menaquinone biosynthesis C-methylase UbiE
MNESGTRRKTDFEQPSLLFLAEDRLKAILGGPLLYNPFFEKQGGFRGDERVLDFGCGGGVGTRCIAKQLTCGGKVTGVDLSSTLLKRARRRSRKYPNAELLKGDIRTLELKKEGFDVISIVHVLHDIDADERASYVGRLANLLKSGGRIWILEPTRESHGMRVEEIRTLMLNVGLEETSHAVRKNDYRGVFQMMKRAPENT